MARQLDVSGRNSKRRAWDAVRRLGEFTLPQLMAEARLAESNARRLIAQFTASGYIAQVGKSEEILRSLIVWRLVKDPGAAWLEADDHRRAPRSRAWQSMRIFRVFRLADIVSTAEISESNAFDYLQALEDVGYVKVVEARDPRRRGSRNLWRLTRNTGPEAPIPIRDGRVYDPNTQKTVGMHRQSVGRARSGFPTKAWAAIRERERKTFTAEDICHATGVGGCYARQYLRALALAGFIHGAKVRTGGPDRRQIEYRLVFDPGPEAPRLMADGKVYNPNDGRIWGQAQ